MLFVKVYEVVINDGPRYQYEIYSILITGLARILEIIQLVQQ